MNYQDITNGDWKDSLGTTFAWLDSVELSSQQTPANSAAIAVLVEVPKNPKTGITLDCPTLNHKDTEAVLESLKSQGLESISKVTATLAFEQLYLLVPKTKYQVTPIESALQAGLDLASEVSSRKLDSLCILPGAETCSVKIFEGLANGLYKNTTYKGSPSTEDAAAESEQTLPQKIVCVGSTISAEQLEMTKIMAQSKVITRSLGDAPSNKLTPSSWGKMAVQMAKESKLTCTIKTRKELEALGMGTFISVSNGSPHEPHMICFEIEGEDNSKTVALIGKGLTFDAGGVSLKPSAGMEDMKYDMCGGAGVFGAAYYFSKRKPPVNVVCLIGTVENLIGPEATKPNEVFRSMSGQTVEVKNTDAEGRLVLCDLLYYARTNWKLDFMVDTATLTGAVLIALGKYGSGVLSKDQEFAQYIVDCGTKAGERSWALPLWPEAMETLKSSHFADLSNIPDPGVRCGTITAAAFLAHFVGDTPWAHIDIAGTGFHAAMTSQAKKGASGVILGTLVESVIQKYK